MRISVVLPAHNETGNIGRLVEETYTVLPRDLLQEVIVVDDCSDDGTREEVLALRPRYRSLRYLRHGTRAGQSAALRTGIRASSAPVIAMMDGDAQNDPADIPNLVAKLGEPGSDGPALIGGLRADRKDTGSKRLASRAANWIRDAVLKDDCPDTGCGIKVYWREAFMRLPFFSTMHRYLPVLFLTYGYRVDYVPVNDRPRMAGKSKYTNFGRALIGLYDLFGVTWLRKRTAVPPVAEDSAEMGEMSERETAA
ncbi:glycosyltransferase family 2 protein [Methyloligella solikamskensis]|uniref:Glycosyltransferase family 2 protein n=1 Tax=Methyloligella solikamskensis TaxID=1177756 RepID=A0ABW3J8Y1_9HYPH